MAEKQLLEIRINSLTYAKYLELLLGSQIKRDEVYNIIDLKTYTQEEIDTKLASISSTGSATILWTDIQGKPTNLVTTEELTAKITALVGSAPEALDTLQELAEKLNDGDSAVASLTTQIAQKADKSYVDEELAKKMNTTNVPTITLVTWSD